MNRAWLMLRERAGDVALLAFGVLAAGALFLATAIHPLETRLSRLNDRLGRDVRQSAPGALRTGTPAEKIAAFYSYFEREDGQVEWLARIYGSARAAGLEFRTAEYRLAASDGRIARYEVAMPLTGTYAQVRAFIAEVLAENPVMSLDQLTLRRKRVNDTLVEANAVLTIHLLGP